MKSVFTFFILFLFISHFGQASPERFSRPICVETLSSVSSDESQSEPHWALRKIKAPEAWKIERGNSNVTIAIMDTGVDHLHATLVENMWNSHDASIPEKFGYNFHRNDLAPIDTLGHGTGVASLAGERAGVAPNVTMMALKLVLGANISFGHLDKILTERRAGEEDDVVKAIRFAISRKAKIINMSFGGSFDYLTFSEYIHLLKNVVEETRREGILIVVAAGNKSRDLDQMRRASDLFYFPEGRISDNVIVVGASTKSDLLASNSNYGKESVDLMAPGDDVRWAIPGGKFETPPVGGNSQSAPFVSGTAALIWSRHPELAISKLKKLF